jgi:hypothetical protein
VTGGGGLGGGGSGGGDAGGALGGGEPGGGGGVGGGGDGSGGAGGASMVVIQPKGLHLPLEAMWHKLASPGFVGSVKKYLSHEPYLSMKTSKSLFSSM